MPEPPKEVIVEPGPQDGTLLVTWLPVALNNCGISNGAVVTGYAIFADGRKVTAIESPTSKSVALDCLFRTLYPVVTCFSPRMS